MYIPYTYFIIHNPTGLMYYGARWAKGCSPSDFWVHYFTSSKRVKQLIDQYGVDSFTFKIRRTFSTAEACKDWERRALKRLDVVRSDKWINRSYGTPPSLYGRRWSQHRKDAARGKKLTQQHKDNISKGNKGVARPQTPEHIAKGAASRLGTSRSVATKQKIKDANYRRSPTYHLTHDDGRIYIGKIPDFCHQYSYNHASVKTSLSARKRYNGWNVIHHSHHFARAVPSMRNNKK